MTEWEPRHTADGEVVYLERFACSPVPAAGESYRVLRDEWTDDDPPRRTIYAIEGATR